MSRPDTPSVPDSGQTGAASIPAVAGMETGPFHRLIAARETSVVVVLAAVAIVLFLSPARDKFYSQANLQNLLLSISLLAIYAIGETIVIITGGIDLSIGSLIAFSGMILAALATALHTRIPALAVGLAILLTLCAAAGIGGFHALLIHRLRLPPFVVTLAALTILRSQSLLLNKQLPITISDFPLLIALANGKLFAQTAFPIPVPLVLLVLIAVLTHVLLAYFRIGRHVYSLGSNEIATELSGVNTGRVKLFAYGASAVLAGVAGILYAGYGSQGDPLSGQGYELNAVAASVIGGASLTGGRGSVAGTLLGACLLNVILNGINLTLTSPSLWEGTVVGGVLLLAVLTTAFQQRRKR